MKSLKQITEAVLWPEEALGTDTKVSDGLNKAIDDSVKAGKTRDMYDYEKASKPKPNKDFTKFVK